MILTNCIFLIKQYRYQSYASLKFKYLSLFPFSHFQIKIPIKEWVPVLLFHQYVAMHICPDDCIEKINRTT
jgi:hypothetical protein